MLLFTLCLFVCLFFVAFVANKGYYYYCICGRYRCPSNQDVEYEEIETKCLTDVVNNAQEEKGGCSHGPYLDANVTVKHVIRVCRTMFNKAKHRV